MGKEWMPYVMLGNVRGYRSAVCNTDEYGFRHTYAGERLLSMESFTHHAGPKGVVVGGSLAFGIGASHDRATIPSLLNQSACGMWWNAGSRGFNSTQEVLWFMLHRWKVDEVLLLSGLNNPIAYAFSVKPMPELGGFIGDSRFHRLMALDERLESALPIFLDAVKRKARATLQAVLPARRRLPVTEAGVSYQAVMKIVERDLDIWCALRQAMGFSLRYCLQPSAIWMRKAPSPEEGELFRMLDTRAGALWQRISRYVAETFPAYREDLRRLCEQREIPFLDCNEAMPAEGWLFCDRVHLTDRGNQAVARLLTNWLL